MRTLQEITLLQPTGKVRNAHPTGDYLWGKVRNAHPTGDYLWGKVRNAHPTGDNFVTTNR